MAKPSHPDEQALLRFLERQDQTPEYVARTAEWIKTEYPGSAATMIPKMRAIYADKRKNQSRG